MINCEGRDETFVFQIQIKIVDILSKEHALVDQGRVAERTDVERWNGRFAGTAFDPPAANIKRTLQVFGAASHRVTEHDLFDCRACVFRLLTDNGHIDRRLTPTIDVEAEMQDFSLHQCPRSFLRCKIRSWQEDLANTDRVICWVMARARDMFPEEILRHFHANTGAIACLAVSIHRSAVPDIFQSLDAHFNDFAARLAIQRSHQTNATRIVFELRVIGMAVDQALTVGFILLYII